MAAITILRSRENIKPGRRIVHIVGTWNSTDTTGTLAVPAGPIIDVRGSSLGVTTPGVSCCSDAVVASGLGVGTLASSTVTGVSRFINMARTDSGSATAHVFCIEYESV